jgi:hypothetical protein
MTFAPRHLIIVSVSLHGLELISPSVFLRRPCLPYPQLILNGRSATPVHHHGLNSHSIIKADVRGSIPCLPTSSIQRTTSEPKQTLPTCHIVPHKLPLMELSQRSTDSIGIYCKSSILSTRLGRSVRVRAQAQIYCKKVLDFSARNCCGIVA